MIHSIEIDAADNGYVLKYRDPEIERRNRDSDCWMDPHKSRVYADVAHLTADLAKLLPIMLERSAENSEHNEYKSAFAEAFSKEK